MNKPKTFNGGQFRFISFHLKLCVNSNDFLCRDFNFVLVHSSVAITNKTKQSRVKGKFLLLKKMGGKKQLYGLTFYTL